MSADPLALKPRWLGLYCGLVGAMDSTTGLLLVVSPALTLRLMGISDIDAMGEVGLRWIGVFVGSVGLAYLYPFALRGKGRHRRLTTVIEVTTLVRTAVGTFVAVALVIGSLVPAWLSVSLTDLGLAAFQLWLVASGRVGNA